MQEKITLVVISGTTNRVVEISRTYLGTVGSSSLSSTNPSIEFTLEPKGDYVLFHVGKELKPGVYRFEFQPESVGGINGILGKPTPTPTQPPVPLPVQKWIFVVK